MRIYSPHQRQLRATKNMQNDQFHAHSSQVRTFTLNTQLAALKAYFPLVFIPLASLFIHYTITTHHFVSANGADGATFVILLVPLPI